MKKKLSKSQNDLKKDFIIPNFVEHKLFGLATKLQKMIMQPNICSQNPFN